MIRTCEQCGEEFSGRADARYHSVACRVAAHRARHAPTATPEVPAAPGPLQPLHCPACSGPIGTSDGETLLLVGAWTVRGEVWRWSAYADDGRFTVSLPATVYCQHCKAEVAA